MSRVLAALASLWPMTAAADPAACAKGFKPEHAVEWGATQGAWNALCAKGFDAVDALRQAQRDSIARCVAKFQPYEAQGKLANGQAQAFCARGASGRAELAESAGLPPERPKPPPGPRIPTRKPGSAGMGPLSQALAKARDAWQADVCLSGVYYQYRVLQLYAGCTREDEYLRRDGFDKYSYFFASPASQRDIYRVIFTDAHNGCPDAPYLKGPAHENFPKTAGLDACLEGVKLDIDQAFAVAAKHGWVPDDTIFAWLTTPPRGFFAKACGSRTDAVSAEPWYGSYKVECGDGRWDQGKLRPATGKPVWILSSARKTAVIDAATGRFRLLGAGHFCFETPMSYLGATITETDTTCEP